jgi:hypothetical protein
MLLHLTPRFYLCYSDVHVDIVDMSIPELGLTLKGDKDVVLRTPYPNKRYKVVCRKKGRKAINGIFIETDKRLNDFTVVTRWGVNSDISVHKIHYHIIDSDYDAVTEYIMMWSGFYGTPYNSRTKEPQWIPAKDQPRMVTLLNDSESKRDESIYNVVDGEGIVRERTEYIEMPTVERERLAIQFWGNKRLPAIEDSFSANVLDYALTIKPNNFSEFGVYAVPLKDWIREIRNDCELDTRFLLILGEIKKKSQFFFSNTNDLINKAKSFSSTYTECSDDGKFGIDSLLTQPVFHVFTEDEKDQ